MKRNKNTGLFGVLLSMVAVALMASCSDWTEVEYINNKKADIAEQDPAKYAKYLENLRNYKESEHTLVYTWLDNSEKTPFSRSQHITDLPDSVDVVGLISPDNLAEWELKDMETVRKDKAMKVIYNVDFDAIKAAYVLKQELATEEEPLAVDFVGFLTDSLEHSLSLAGKYNYDGICILYSGKSRIHMRPDELKEYTANERTFINIISDWHQRNPERSIAFEGCPQNLIDLTLLQDCEVVFLSAKKATNKYQFDYILSEAKSKNVLEVELYRKLRHGGDGYRS